MYTPVKTQDVVLFLSKTVLKKRELNDPTAGIQL